MLLRNQLPTDTPPEQEKENPTTTKKKKQVHVAFDKRNQIALFSVFLFFLTKSQILFNS